MPKNLFLTGLALAIGITIGVYATRDRNDEAAQAPARAASLEERSIAAGVTPAASFDGAVIDALRQRLDDEARARRALEQRVSELVRQVEMLESASADPATGSETAADDDTTTETSDRREAGWLNTQALIESGMDDMLAGELQLFYEQIEMDRLYLRDQSLREDWDRDAYRSALDELEDRESELRQRLGEEGYDAYLYASGQPNRVAVTSVIASAPAGQVGIEAGDHILRYDNQRIYNWFELREATAGGNIGDTVAVEVDRDGQTLQFYLARGPLGIRMNTLSVAPD